MAEERVQRRLAAILAADVVGYSRLMESDETGTVARLRSLRAEVFDPATAQFGGRIFKNTGDGALAEFSSAVDAVQCAVEIQRALAARNTDLTEDNRILLRIGISLGDVIVEGDDLYGNGVNIAARMEGLAEPGTICVSGNVHEHVRNAPDVTFENLGEQAVKNIAEPVRAYKVMSAPGHANSAVPPRPRRNVRMPLLVAGAALVLFAGFGALWFVSRPAPRTETVAAKAVAEAVPVAVKTPGSIPEGKPSIAVLPFINMSGDKEQEYFADGMTEDLITDLSKVSGLLVIARNSTFAYKGKLLDVREVGKSLNARYVVEGSVRRMGGRVRINAQLIDAASGSHVWADRYDREFKDVFSLQDEVIEKIVSQLKVTLTPDERRRLARHRTDNAQAYDLYLQGRRQESFFTKQGNQAARRLLQQAVDLDPGFALAYAYLAQNYGLASENRWVDDLGAAAKKALELAELAVKLNPELPQAHWSLGRILTRPPIRDPQRGLEALRRSVELDPSYADGHAFLANVLIYVGRDEEALRGIETAMRINPHFPFWYIHVRGLSKFMLGRFEESVLDFRAAAERNPTVAWPRRFLLAAYGHLGNADDAKWELSELESLGQRPTVKRIRQASPIVHEPSLKLYLDGLRKAGVPEE